MARALPRVEGSVLLNLADGTPTIHVDTPAWYTWLEQATSFTFVGESGRFTARKERRRQIDGYWKAYRKRAGLLRSVYLGRSSDLTFDRLQAAAEVLATPTDHAYRGATQATSSASAAVTPGPVITRAPQSPVATLPLLLTKLYPPVLHPGLVARPRLVERVQAGLTRKVLLLTAPAGFGKTSLLSEWRATPHGQSMPLAWISLDSGDDDPQNYFWSSLSSIQGVSLAIALVTILYWGTLALLAIHALVRIVMVNLMLIVSPFAGLAIATGGGWNYARVWFFRFVELLATPLIWGLTLGFGRALMTGFGVDTQPILGPILAVITMLMVFKAPRMLGFAAQEAVTGARSLWRMSERAAFAGMMGGGAAAGAAAGTAAGASAAGSSGNAPTIYVDMRNAGVVDGQYRQEWDGPSFGAAASRAALPPASAPQIIDGDK